MFVTYSSIEIDIAISDGLLAVSLTGLVVDSVRADDGFPWKRGTAFEAIDGVKLIRTVGQREPETIIDKWQDWVDYWAVCYDFGSRQESRPCFEAGPIFTSDWQDFREKKKRSIELTSPPQKHGPFIAVQLVDIFANELLVVFASEHGAAGCKMVSREEFVAAMTPKHMEAVF